MTWATRALRARPAVLAQLAACVVVLATAWVPALALVRGDEVPSGTLLPLAVVGGLALWPIGRELAESLAAEVALLRVRGMPRLGVVTGCALPVLLVGSAATLAGLGLGALLLRWIGPFLHASPDLPQDPVFWLGVAAPALGALLVVLASLGAALPGSTADAVTGRAVRRHRTLAGALVSLLLVVATVVVVRDATVGDSTWSVLVAPVLLGLVAAEILLLALTRTGPLLGRLATRPTLHAWLGLRLLRRVRDIAVPVRVLVASGVLCAFAATAVITTDDWVDDAALVQTGAAHRFEVDGGAAQAIALTEELDPHGRHLVAAAYLDDGATDVGPVAWVDASRFADMAGDLRGTPAADVPAAADEVAVGGSSNLTTGTELSISARFFSRQPSSTRVVLGYVNGDNFADTATVVVEGEGGEVVQAKAPLQGCARGCGLRSLTIRSAEPTSVRFRSVTAGPTDLLRSGWTRVEPPRRAATGDDDTLDYFLDATHYLALRPPGSDGPAPVIMAGDDPPYEVSTAAANDHPTRVVARTDALPLAGDAGALGDLRYQLGEGPTVASADVVVLADGDTPAPMLRELAQASDEEPVSAAAVEDQLAESTGLATPYALLGIGIAGLLLAGLSALGARPLLRALVHADEAALRGVGVMPTTLLDARRVRTVAVAVGVAVTVLLGAYAATKALLPELPLAVADVPMPPWRTSLHWLPVLLVAALTVLTVVWGLAGPRPAAGESDGADEVTDVGGSSGLFRVVARGLRTRTLLSAGVLLLTGLAIGSAVLGPTFARAVTSSYLVTRVDESPVSNTGLTWTYQPGPVSASPAASAEAVGEVLDDRAGPYFGTPSAQIVSAPYPFREAELTLLSKPDICQHLEVTGRCPTAPDEAMLATGDLRSLGLEVSDRFPGPGGSGTLRLVGSYEAPEGDSDYWFDTSRLASTPSLDSLTVGHRPARPSPAVVTPEAFDRVPSKSWALVFDSLLTVGPDAGADDLESAGATAEELSSTDESVGGGHLVGQGLLNDLPAIADELAAQQATARNSIAPAMISLIVVALALLTRLLMAVNQLRIPELALASLRGASGRRLWSLALAEPLLLILAAVPVGLAMGLVGVRLLARAWLVPGLPITLPATAVGATVLVVLAAVGVSAAVVWQLLRVPLAGQLAGVQRPPSTAAAGHAVRIGLWLVVALATLLLVARVLTSDSGSPDVAGMLLPILVAVTVGTVAAQALAWVARSMSRRRWSGRSLVSFVATRSVSRRGESSLVILPLSVAAAICVFAVGVFGAAAGWRVSVSATEAPADQVWTSPLAPQANFDLARQVDPDGRWLTAATYATYPRASVVLLDGHRLDRTTVWPDQWTDDATASQLGRELAGSAEEPPVLTGRRLQVSVEGSPSATPVFVTAALHEIGGPDREVSVGPFEPGSTRAAVAVPQCERGCELRALTLGGDESFPLAMAGDYRVSLDVDGTPWTGLEHAQDWSRPASASEATPIRDVRVDGGVVTLDVDTGGAPDRATLQPFAVPDRVPVVVGDDAMLAGGAGDPSLRLSDASVVVDPVATAGSLPFAGPRAVLADFRQFTAVEELFEDYAESYVLARGDTPSDVDEALLSAGLEQTGAYGQEKKVQDSTAYAVALRLYAVVAILVLLMAIAGLAISIAVQLPTRRRDAASLRVVGVRRRAIMGAVATEHAAVLAATAVAGLLSGFLATQVLLRSITLGTVEDVATPAVSSDVDWVVLGLQTGVALAVLLATAAVSSLLTVRGARGSTLRENAR